MSERVLKPPTSLVLIHIRIQAQKWNSTFSHSCLCEAQCRCETGQWACSISLSWAAGFRFSNVLVVMHLSHQAYMLRRTIQHNTNSQSNLQFRTKLILHASSHQSTDEVVLLESREHKIHTGIDSPLFYPGASAAWATTSWINVWSLEPQVIFTHLWIR